mmetsp:Transcript_26333/g.37401  ORF Transcript_26333/g.37401 Transcript_26333/m.37401 type:complete len:80 (-) Transcript_26333:35-274(-)
MVHRTYNGVILMPHNSNWHTYPPSMTTKATPNNSKKSLIPSQTLLKQTRTRLPRHHPTQTANNTRDTTPKPCITYEGAI